MVTWSINWKVEKHTLLGTRSYFYLSSMKIKSGKPKDKRTKKEKEKRIANYEEKFKINNL